LSLASVTYHLFSASNHGAAKHTGGDNGGAGLGPAAAAAAEAVLAFPLTLLLLPERMPAFPINFVLLLL
jgi:hypothetical protein